MKIERKEGIKKVRVTHNKVLFWIIIFLLAVLIILALSIRHIGNNNSPANQTINASGIACSSDSDCVAGSCCHSKNCVPKTEAPLCNKVYCTAECEPGTLDCQQGSCKCTNGKCEAVIK